MYSTSAMNRHCVLSVARVSNHALVITVAAVRKTSWNNAVTRRTPAAAPVGSCAVPSVRNRSSTPPAAATLVAPRP